VTGPRQPSRWPRTERLGDGTEYRIRPIHRDDAERERAFILGLSSASRFDRLLYTMREPSAEFVARLVDVDMHRDAALAAVTGLGRAEAFIGVARYAADAGGDACEFAVAVADAWQGRGIGSTLCRLLFDHAAREGFHAIYGVMRAGNTRMLELAEWLGLTVEAATPGQTTVRASRALD
jgi:acetyltransferase